MHFCHTVMQSQHYLKQEGVQQSECDVQLYTGMSCWILKASKAIRCVAEHCTACHKLYASKNTMQDLSLALRRSM